MSVRTNTTGRSNLLIDLGDVGKNVKGVARVLTSLAPPLAALAPDRYHAVCTPAGKQIVDQLNLGIPVHVVRDVPGTVWEQIVLPSVAARLRASAVYAHRECGALWGPHLVLHVPEDPEIRWRREPTSEPRELARRRYSRTMMNRSLIRSTVVASTNATVRDLVENHQLAAGKAKVVPLGVDLDLFRPDSSSAPAAPYFFHLASSDERDRTALLVRSFACYRLGREVGGSLVIGGTLGTQAPEIERLITDLGIAEHTELLGRLSDEDLAQRYAGALASVQASPDEGFGLQALEAMACGSLLISTPAEAVREVVGEGVVLWAEPEVEAIAEALRAASDNRELSFRATTVNRERAEYFSWGRAADSMHALLTVV